MFGLGMSEILVVLTIGVVLFGGSKLPDVARWLGRSFAEFRNEVSSLSEDLGGRR
jgi:TatA/E family protein of Tat protein translocase